MNLFAFWQYNLFPYCCGGNVTQMNMKGSVETVEYGKGYFFPPLKMLPKEQGEEIKAKIEELTAEYNKAKETLHKTYLTRLLKIAPFLEKNE